jgi:hypothetical protein
MQLVKVLCVVLVIMGAGRSVSSQNYNEYDLVLGHENGRNFDTIVTKIKIIDQVSTKHALAHETAKILADEYGMQYRLKWVRRLKNTEEKKRIIYIK